MTKHFAKTLIALCALFACQQSAAQFRTVATDTVVSLVTFHPGSDIYELEGHTALRVTTPEGIDIAANWGLFDFNTPNFVYRFVKGETDYCTAQRSTPPPTGPSTCGR